MKNNVVVNKKFFEKFNVHPETQKIILEVLDCLILEGKTDTSVLKYGEVSRRFFSDIQKSVSEITYDDVYNWLEEKYKNKSEVTYRFNLAILRGFFKRCYRLDFIKEVPVKHWWGPKIGGSIPKHLTDKELSQVRILSESMSPRDRNIVTLLFDTGCRLSELTKLNIDDIDIDSRQIKLEGKGQKKRIVSISSDTAILLRKYLESHEGKSPELFLSKYGSRLCQRRVEQIIGNLGKKLSKPKNLTPHMARHTYATQRLKKGESIDAIKVDMGHAFASTTAIYAVVPKAEFINMYHKIAG